MIATFVLVVTALIPAGRAEGQSNTTAQILSRSVLTWSPVTGSGPPPLINASMVYDSDTRTVVLFGGETASGGISNDTWVWNGSSWTDYPATRIQAPPARELASIAFDPVLHQLILFGGEDGNGQPLGDTWAWNGASWYQISPSTLQSPSARFGASMSFDAKGQIVLFGGTGYASHSPAAGAGAPVVPTPRSTGTTSGTSTPVATTPPATAAASPGPLQSFSDTWVWTGAGWTQVTGSGPSARSDAAMTFDSASGQTVLFGGQTDPAGSTVSHVLSDTWIWNGSRWVQARPKARPPARTGAALTDGPDLAAAVLAGGEGTGSQYRDTWLWTRTTWIEAKAGGGPAPSSGAAAAYDDAKGKELLFGGTSTTAGGPTSYLLSVSAKPSTSAPSRPTTTEPPAARTTSPTRAGGRSTSTTSTVPARGPTPVTRSHPDGAPLPLRATASNLRPGSLVTLSGSGFRPDSVVTITFHSTPLVVARVTANQSGEISATVAVPTSASAGQHHFEASGTATAGNAIQLTAAVNVLGPGHGSDPPLEETLALVGAALLIPGVAWLAMGAAARLRRP